MKILIVEDDAKTAHAIRSGLEAEGYSAHVAATGDEGSARLAAESFDLVVLDWMLPGRDGIEILRELRKHGALDRKLVRCLGRKRNPAQALAAPRRRGTPPARA